VIIFSPTYVSAEWYVGGYGGGTFSSSLKDVTMPEYGQRQVLNDPATFPNAGNPTIASFTQTFNTSDISLASSLILGAKVGYFFSEEKFPWFGLELEAFTTKPDIKQQTVSTTQNVSYVPVLTTPPCNAPGTCPFNLTTQSSLDISGTSLRVSTLALNVIARYPGKLFQPYVGVGGGAFYFNSSGQFDGRQVVPGLNAQVGLKVLATEEWGVFVEGKYNYATITNLDPSGFGLSGVYSAFNILGGIVYHF